MTYLPGLPEAMPAIVIGMQGEQCGICPPVRGGALIAKPVVPAAPSNVPLSRDRFDAIGERVAPILESVGRKAREVSRTLS